MTPTAAQIDDRGERTPRRSSRSFWVTAGVVLLGTALIRATVVGPVRVSSASMEPTYRAGDVVLVTQWGPDPDGLDRGDLVVFEDPAEHRPMLKRVVGLPGEAVVVKDGVLYVDDARVREPWVDHALVDGYYSRTFHVPPGTVFVMGDNRANSVDSRDYGPVGASELEGTVALRLWPPRTG